MTDKVDGTGTTQLFGTVEIDGVGIFYAFVRQQRLRTVWVLTDREIQTAGTNTSDHVVAILRTLSVGRAEGQGKVYLLTRLLGSLNSVVGHAATAGAITASQFISRCEWSSPNGDQLLNFTALPGGRRYKDLTFVYEGFRVDLHQYTRNLPVSIPTKLTPVEDDKTKAAMIAGLGVRTFAILKRQRGHSLDWYDKKKYKLIQTAEEFQAMMLEFLRDVQHAHESNATVLTALDTETTGLNMYNLDPSNPYRDHIVAIPFGWKADEAYVVCMDMYYFSNVAEDEVYPLFQKLFQRNPDFSYQDIELDYCGQHFSFNRRNILLVGANVGFDIQAFLTHNCTVFFDEDVQIMHYNLATDWVQGKNSLKFMTHRYIGDETLELEDLFGRQHKDKYRYLSDPQLALVYGGADADYPRVLWKMLRKTTPDNLYGLYKKYDMPLRNKTAQATWIGLPDDERAVRDEGNRVLQDLETLKNFVYKYAYAANHQNLSDKAARLSELLGVSGISDIQQLGDTEGMYRYPFTPANHKRLLFNILGYPVIKMSEKSQEPALDKHVLEKLVSRTREAPVEFLLEDIPSVADPSTPLISKDEFNRCMYPLALVFQKYAIINKEYTAYYKPIMEHDMEGKMFYSFSFQRAATRRILSPGQTIKSSLKKLIIAPPKKLFMCFDASQIEYRHMASLAYKQTKGILMAQYPEDWEKRLADTGISRIVKLMHNKEADYHIETAAMMTGVPQYRVDHATRKKYKTIGFGIPYGLGDRSLCVQLFGKATPEAMKETEEILTDYKTRQIEIIRLLESVRDSAFVPAKISDGLRDMLAVGDTHLGLVQNFVGFYRLFILENLTRARTQRIRRQAGNCVIQGGAAELYRRMLYGFHQGCVKNKIADKVQWLMLVHDELDTIVDSDIDVCLLLDTLQSNCTLRYEDHIPYYIGIGFGHNWHDAKDDAAELPVIMVDRIIEAYHAGKFSIPSDGCQAENLLALKRHYLCDRIGEVLGEIVPGINKDFVWSDKSVDAVDKGFTNYVVRAYLPTFCTKADKAKAREDAILAGQNPKKAEVPLKVQLERWLEARKEYGFNKTFLDEELKSADVEVKEMVLDASLSDVDGLELSLDEMRIDLLEENTDELESLELQNSDSWFSEGALFDHSIPQDEIDVDSSEGYRYFNDESKEDDFQLSSAPTSAFDVFVSNKYMRQHIFSSGDKVFTVMLSGTALENKVSEIAQLAKTQFKTGDKTLLIIGSSIKKIAGLMCDTEELDTLDKTICAAAKAGA